MSQKQTIKIGFAGLGVVGQGVWKHLLADRPALEYRLGAVLEPYRAAVRDLSKPRDVDIPEDKLCTDPMAVATDPEVDIFCELMGGIELAKAVTLAALEAGKIVVTANKALICDHGEELFQAARRGNGHYFFEASVAGGIPIIKAIREGLIANRFTRIAGILNGTTNYILTRMEREGASYDDVVDDARNLGYVEADEALDLDGIDAAHKAVILAYLAHGKWVALKDVQVEGIRNVSLTDIRHAGELGYKIKLLGDIQRDFDSNTLNISVLPTFVPKKHILGQVDEVYNGISVTGDIVGTTTLIGRGAGQDATASAVISDIADAALAKLGGPAPAISEEDVEIYKKLGEGLGLTDAVDIERPFYLRLTVADRPGVLAKVATVLSEDGVSIATLNQEQNPDNTANLLLTTHTSNEACIAAALEDLKQLDTVHGEPVLMRIAQFAE